MIVMIDFSALLFEPCFYVGTLILVRYSCIILASYLTRLDYVPSQLNYSGNL